MGGEVLWFISRAAGVVAMVMLTAVFVLGVVVSSRALAGRASNAVMMGLHRTISLLLVTFLGVHVVTAIVETYVNIDWLSLLIPFTSGYERLWVGLGTIAFDLMLTLSITGLLRSRINEKVWRAVHLLAFAMWPIALVHGYLLGTGDQLALRMVTVVCGVIGTAVAAWRFTVEHSDTSRRLEVAAGEWR